MRKWMDKGAATAEGGTPAPRGVGQKATKTSNIICNMADWFLTE